MRSARPLARAVRTKSSPSVSSMLERVCRAITPAPKSPRLTAGRIRWAKLPVPPAGSQGSSTEKSRIRISPDQKMGVETPASASAVAAKSSRLARWVALRMPRVTPTSVATRIAAPASSSVRRNRSPSSPATGSEVAVERPRSPRASPATYAAYCTGSGRSSRQRWRSSATVWSVAKSPARMRAGSPGIRRTTVKTSTVTRSSAGMPARQRVRQRRSIARPGGRAQSSK